MEEAVILVREAALVTLVVCAAYTDIRDGRVPDRYSYGCGIVGLLAGLALGRFTPSLVGAVAGAGILLVPYLAGWIGGGDLKMMAAVGALRGQTFLLPVLIYTAIAGGILAACIVVVRLVSRRRARGVGIPYAVAISAGVVIAGLAGAAP